MRIAIMQPYFLPYLGYFQLIRSVDKFVLYDDVDFIVRGWVNRNRFWIGGRDSLLTIPLQNGRRGVPINEVVVAEMYDSWKRKFLKSVTLNYSKSLNFEEVYCILEASLNTPSYFLADINYRSLMSCCAWIGLKTEIIKTSGIYGNRELDRAERLLDICKKEGATDYVNAIGGRDLYAADWFKTRGVSLHFLEPDLKPYPARQEVFTLGLSVLDFMMHVPKPQALDFLGEGRLV